MKVFNFNTHQEFLNVFCGEIYEIHNESGQYLCDMHTTDYIQFCNDGKIQEYDNRITSEKHKQDILQQAIYINIKGK